MCSAGERGGCGDRDSGLSRGEEPRVEPALFRCACQFERSGHLSDRAVAADRQDDARVDTVGVPREESRRRRRANVPDRRPSPLRRGGKLGILAEELVQAADDLEAGFECLHDLRTPGGRERAARRSHADPRGLHVKHLQQRVIILIEQDWRAGQRAQRQRRPGARPLF